MKARVAERRIQKQLDAPITERWMIVMFIGEHKRT